MTVSSPNVIEIKLDRLIDDVRFLRSQMIAFDRHLKGIEASLKPSEPSEQQPESKSRPWFVAAATATARTVLILFAVGAATSAALLYLGTCPRQRDCDLRVNEYTPSGYLLPPSPPAEKATAREISSYRSASETRSSASTIQLIRSSLAKGFNFFSSVETRSRNSFMTL